MRPLFFLPLLLIGLVAFPLRVFAAPPTAAECVDAATQGQKLRDDNKYIDAKSQFAVCGADACPKTVKRQCLKWLEEIDERMPSVVLAVRDAKGADVTDVTLTIDNKALGSKVGEPFVIDPGQHLLRVMRNGKTLSEQKIVISAAEKNRIVRIQLEDTPAPPPPPQTVTPLPPPTPPNDTKSPATQTTTTSGGPPIVPIVLAAVAVVGFAGFGYFGLTSRSDLSDLESSPCAATRTCNESDVSSIKTRLVLADVSLSVGIVALVTSAVSYFAMKKPSSN